jgi:hypothetical protein
VIGEAAAVARRVSWARWHRGAGVRPGPTTATATERYRTPAESEETILKTYVDPSVIGDDLFVDESFLGRR